MASPINNLIAGQLSQDAYTPLSNYLSGSCVPTLPSGWAALSLRTVAGRCARLHLAVDEVPRHAAAPLRDWHRALIARQYQGRPGVRNLQLTPFALDRRPSRVASGSPSASASATYQAS